MASVTWTSLTPHAPTAEFPGAYDYQYTIYGPTNKHVYDWSRGVGYVPIVTRAGTPLGGIQVTDLNTFAVTALPSLNSMYSGTAYGLVAGTPPSQNIYDVATGNNTNVYLTTSNDGAEGDNQTHRLTRVNPTTWKVTGEFYTNTSSTGCVYFATYGIVNKINGTTDIVAYWAKIQSDLQIFNGATMALLGYSAATIPAFVGGVRTVPGAQNADGSCDFWIVYPNAMAMELWRVRVSSAGAISTTRTGIMDGTTVWPGGTFQFQRLDYDATNGNLFLWASGTTNGPATLAVVTQAGGILWTYTTASRIQELGSYGTTNLVGRTIGVLYDGDTFVLLNTATGAAGETLDIIPPSGVTGATQSFFSAYNAATFSFYSNGATGDYTLIAPPPRVPGNPRCGSATQTTIRPTWDEVTGAASYTVRWRQAGGTTWTTVSGITGTSVTITGLANATSYEWQVATAISEFSATTTCTTLAAGVAITRVALLRPPKLHFIGVS
jgi:hypothetical protein